MNDSTKIKWLTGITLALILLNVSIVAFIWFPPHPPGPGRGGRERGETIIRELKLNDAQRKQFEDLRDEHHHIIVTINEKDRHTHDVLFDLLKNGKDTTAVVDSLITEIAENRKQIEYATYYHLAQVRKICTPEQQKKFDDIIINLMTRGGEGPPPQDR